MSNKVAKRDFFKVRSHLPIWNDRFGCRSMNGASGEPLAEVDVLKIMLYLQLRHLFSVVPS